jgi:hypothetical protein
VKLADLILASGAADIVKNTRALLQSINKRDDEIQFAINQNDKNTPTMNEWLCYGKRPNTVEVEFNGGTPVELLGGPPEGTSRLVNLVSLVNLDSANRLIYLYMQDGADNYGLYYDGTQAPHTTANFLLGAPGPFVLENGDSLYIVASVKAFDEAVAVVDYADDTSGRWHCARTEVGDETVTVLLETPPGGVRRIVKLVQYQNRDTVSHVAQIGTRNTSTADIYWRVTDTLAAGVYATYPECWNSIILKPGFELVVEYTGATITNASRATAHYYESLEDDSIAS